MRYLDQTVALPQYQGSVRQLVVCGLGHEKPTFLLTNDLPRRLQGFESSTPQKLYRKFVNTPGRVEVGEGELRVRFEKRSHNPILKEAGLERLTGPIPWCQNLRLRMIFP